MISIVFATSTLKSISSVLETGVAILEDSALKLIEFSVLSETVTLGAISSKEVLFGVLMVSKSFLISISGEGIFLFKVGVSEISPLSMSSFSLYCNS